MRYNAGMNVRTMQTHHLEAALEPWGRTEHLGRVPRDEVEQVLPRDPGLALVAEDAGEVGDAHVPGAPGDC